MHCEFFFARSACIGSCGTHTLIRFFCFLFCPQRMHCEFFFCPQRMHREMWHAHVNKFFLFSFLFASHALRVFFARSACIGSCGTHTLIRFFGAAHVLRVPVAHALGSVTRTPYYVFVSFSFLPAAHALRVLFLPAAHA